MGDTPYKRYFESMPAYLTILDRDLRIVEANDRFRRDFGDFEGKLCFQINQHRAERCESCPAERTFRDGQTHETEEKFTTRAGQELFLLIYTTPITDEAGTVTHLLRMATDITEIKLRENQIRDSRERYRQLFEEVPCYISIQDHELRIVEANRRLREDFSALPGDKCHQTYMHRAEPCVPCIVRQTFDDGEIHQTEEVMTSARGDQLNVLVHTAPVRDTEGRIRNIIEICTDITQIRQLQSQLTSLGLIISSISHGIKGLLTSLDGGVYLVNTGLAKNDRVRFEQGWKMVERNITRVRRMVLDLLYYAKDRVPELETIPALAVAEEVCEVMRGKAGEIGIDFRWEMDRHAGDLEADSKAVRSLLVNLVENAIDACRVDKKKAAHQVRIGLKGYPDHVEFEVEDNGIGMDQEIRERAFSLFFSSKRGSGTGLGLFISNKIAQAHGGEIKIESELNRGTRMIVMLPRKPVLPESEPRKV